MNDAARGRHPLDVAGTDHTAVAGGVTMLDLAVIDDGDGLETAMRMLADAAPLLRWFEIVRPCIVEQQEWAHVRAQRVVREERADGDAVAPPMLPVVAVTTLHSLRHFYPLTPLCCRAGSLMGPKSCPHPKIPK